MTNLIDAHTVHTHTCIPVRQLARDECPHQDTHEIDGGRQRLLKCVVTHQVPLPNTHDSKYL